MKNIPPPCSYQWSRLPAFIRLQLAFTVFRHRHRLSLGQAFCLRLAAIAFIIYQFLPNHPLSLPTAIGLACSIASIIFVERSHQLIKG